MKNKITTNIILVVLEDILDRGIDNMLEKLDVTEEDLENYPHVKEAIKERVTNERI